MDGLDYVYMRGGRGGMGAQKSRKFVEGFYRRNGAFVKGFYAKGRKKRRSRKRRREMRGKGIASDIALVTAQNFSKSIPDILSGISNKTKNKKIKQVLDASLTKTIARGLSGFVNKKLGAL